MTKSTNIKQLSLNYATVKEQFTLEEAIRVCADAGIPAIAPWRDALQACGVDRAARLIKEHDLSVSSLCRGGFFPYSNAKERQASLDDNRRAIEEAAIIGAECLVLVVGGLPGHSKDIAGARTQVEEMIAEVLPDARAANMPLAIEPLHSMYAADRACVNTLGQANDICERLGKGVGVAIDVYHVWWDPDLQAEIKRAGAAGTIFGFHLCDWLVPTRDLLVDRGMMGDGVIDLPLIRSWIEDAGYNSFYEVEIFSALDWWKKPGREVVDTVIERFMTVC